MALETYESVRPLMDILRARQEARDVRFPDETSFEKAHAFVWYEANAHAVMGAQGFEMTEERADSIVGIRSIPELCERIPDAAFPPVLPEEVVAGALDLYGVDWSRERELVEVYEYQYATTLLGGALARAKEYLGVPQGAPN
jgi:hypothetical protein